MRGTTLWFALVLAVLAGACGGENGEQVPPETLYKGFLQHTLVMGASDNSEVVKIIPGTQHAVLVASKTRKVTLLGILPDQVTSMRSKILFEADPSESELTHIDFGGGGAWAVLTRTILDTDQNGDQTDCRGELVFVDVTDTDAFGTVLKQVEVGPMPDSVDVSPDGKWVVSANERDKLDLYGKCAVTGLTPSVSVVQVEAGVAAAVEVARVPFVNANDDREPEAVIIASDSDTVGVSVQDSQELVLFKISELAISATPPEEKLTAILLPKNVLGDDPWPDGIVAFKDKTGREVFALAGEFNDTIMLYDLAGQALATIDILASDMPASFPRGEAPAVFRPDSLASYTWQDEVFLTASLKAAGAVGIWKVSDATQPKFSSAVKVGLNDPAGPTQESEIGSEGISAESGNGVILCANEGQSSVSLIIPSE